MKKLWLIALLCPSLALAQTYPSPTFNSLTLQTPLTAANGGTGATSSTGSGPVVLATSPIIFEPTFTGVSTISSLTSTSTGQFYQNLGANVSRIQDRLFVGSASANLGTNVNSQPDWLTTYQLAKGRSYGYVQTSTLAVENASNSSSETTLVSGAQVGAQSGTQPIAITGIGVNNGASGSGQAWAGYFEGYRDTTGSATGGAYGIEADTMNYVGAADSDPYQQNSNQTITYQAAAGGGYSPTGQYPSTAALNIQNNGSTYDRGIIFGSNAISGATGTSGTGIAIALGLGHELQWYGAAATPTSSILSTGTTTAAGIQQIFQNYDVTWNNSNGNPIFTLTGLANGTNGISVTEAVSGVPPTLSVQGSDPNITMLLVPKGTGSVQVNSTSNSGNTFSVSATSNTSSGASIFLSGNGATTPNKYLRSFNGSFQIVNSANSSSIMSMDDYGNVTFTGDLTSQAGSFTTISSAGSITPSQTAGIIGTTTNNNANSGSVGEYISNSGRGVSLTSNTPTNITSISLTAGDWDVSGTVTFVPANTTSPTLMQCGISTTSSTFNGLGSQSFLNLAFPTTGVSQGFVAPVQRISIASSTTVYLVAESSFTISTMTANGFIRARRVR